jgi:hypothetical protein
MAIRFTSPKPMPGNPKPRAAPAPLRSSASAGLEPPSQAAAGKTLDLEKRVA